MDRTNRDLYRYLRHRDRMRRPRLWPLLLLIVVLVLLFMLLFRTRILIVL